MKRQLKPDKQAEASFTARTEEICVFVRPSTGPKHVAGSVVLGASREIAESWSRLASRAPILHGLSGQSLSDDLPFRPLTDKEARRQVVSAYFYYGFLAATLLAVLIWH